MSAEDLEKYETEMELQLYREYKDIVGQFSYVVETDRRFYLTNEVDLQPRNAGGDVYFELTLKDAWVWDMYRPARFVKNVRVVTFKDVNVEELDKPDLEVPDGPTTPPFGAGVTLDPTAAAIRDNYRVVAAQYDGDWADMLFSCASCLPELAEPHGVVVELGCGPARLAASLCTAGRTVVGLDLSDPMLRRAPATVGRVLADAHRLPLRSSSIDVLYAPFVLFHLTDLPAALAEVRRVLVPGGRAAALSWSEPDPHPAYDVWVSVVDAAGAPPDLSPQMPAHGTTRAAGPLAAAWRAAGFHDVQVTEQRYRWQPDAAQFVAHSAVVGSVARRLRQLPDEVRLTVLDDARRQLSVLPPEAFVESGTLLASVAA